MPSCCAVTLKKYDFPLCTGAGGACCPCGGGVYCPMGIDDSGWSIVLAMKAPGTVYSWPLSSEKCICQTSSSPGEENIDCIENGSPPLRVPLLTMATRGRTACTSTGEFELDCP